MADEEMPLKDYYANIRARLKRAGVSEVIVEKHILPTWWGPEYEASLLKDFEYRIASYLSTPVETVRDPHSPLKLPESKKEHLAPSESSYLGTLLLDQTEVQQPTSHTANLCGYFLPSLEQAKTFDDVRTAISVMLESSTYWTLLVGKKDGEALRHRFLRFFQEPIHPIAQELLLDQLLGQTAEIILIVIHEVADPPLLEMVFEVVKKGHMSKLILLRSLLTLRGLGEVIFNFEALQKEYEAVLLKRREAYGSLV